MCKRIKAVNPTAGTCAASREAGLHPKSGGNVDVMAGRMKVTREPTRRFLSFRSAGSPARAAAARDLVANGALPVDLHLQSLPGSKARVFGPIGMEQLWNRGGATGGKRSARETPENGLNYRQTVATG